MAGNKQLEERWLAKKFKSQGHTFQGHIVYSLDRSMCFVRKVLKLQKSDDGREKTQQKT